jgi:hypothetical protein
VLRLLNLSAMADNIVNLLFDKDSHYKRKETSLSMLHLPSGCK